MLIELRKRKGGHSDDSTALSFGRKPLEHHEFELDQGVISYTTPRFKAVLPKLPSFSIAHGNKDRYVPVESTLKLEALLMRIDPSVQVELTILKDKNIGS